MLAALKAKIEAGSVPKSSAPSEPRGRAAILSKLKAKGVPGKTTEDKSPPGSGVFPTGTRPSPPSSESPKSSDSPKTPPSLQTPSSVGDPAAGLAKMKIGQDLKPPVVKKGEGGNPVKLSVNYVRLDMEKGKAMLAALKAKIEAGSVPKSSAPSQPRGRAAILSKLKAKGVPGKTTEDKSPPGSGVFPTGTRPSPPSSESPKSSDSPKTPPSLQTPSSVGDPAAGLAKMRIGKDLKPPVVKKGQGGKPVSLSVNYVRLDMEKGKGVFEYEVTFEPRLDARNIRFKCLNQQREVIGPTKMFDGATLILPFQLPEKKTVLQSDHPSDGSPVTLTITLKWYKRMGDRDCIQLYNILFNRIMDTLKMVMMNRNYYDPRNGHMIPQHKLEVWPGYVTAVQEYEDGVMLCVDVSHRVLRTQTVRDHLMDVMKMSKDNFNTNAQKALIGGIVLTRYNNRCYKIDDIDFEANPSSTFTGHTGREISFVEYYKRQYNIDIKDLKQPLLIHREKKKTQEEQGVTKLICLVPELTFMTGLTDAMRADFRVMKDVAMYTRVTPNQRQLSLKKFIQNVNSSEEAKAHLKNWGLKLSPNPIRLDGRVLDPETIHLGQGFKFRVGPKADWGKETTNNHCLTCVDITNWLVVFVQKNEKETMNFVGLMKKLGPRMGIQVAAPKLGRLANDRTETYLKTIRDNVDPDVQVVVAIMPTPRDDRYAAVKKLCCVEKPVASQVINLRTIANEKKVSSVVQKIALQMNCKLGGELWACSTPFKNTMVVGVDVYHDPARRLSSIAGVVTSLNHTFSRWHSSTCEQAPGQELVPLLKIAFIKGLKKYFSTNHSWPDKVIIFRDGVGDGQLEVSAKHEVEQLKACFKNISDDYSPGLGFVVVQKRINTRIFRIQGKDFENPAPGTVLDHTVTKRDWYDFFLVSQHVGQGTVSPSHYIVVDDSSGLNPDMMQKLAYKLTHMYYNWPGTVRVPAPCQYAHKLAYQVGQHIRKEPHAKLEERLFYL